MNNTVAVVGSRDLPASWSGRVHQVVSQLLARGCQVASGGALGADLFTLQAVIAAGRSAGASVFIPGVSIQQSPMACHRWLGCFEQEGGTVVPGQAQPGANKDEFVAALFARSVALVQACKGVVAFISGQGRGSWFTCQQAARLGRSVVVFPVAGPSALKSLGCGGWQPVASWSGAWRWVPSVPVGSKCRHGISVASCSGLPLREPF